MPAVSPHWFAFRNVVSGAQQRIARALLETMRFIPEKKPGARQLVRQDGGAAAPRAGRGRAGWPMTAHHLAGANQKGTTRTSQSNK